MNREEKRRKNIVFITCDALRADLLESSMYSSKIAPHLEDLREESVSFTAAFANGPNTASSFPSILTSTYPLMYDGYDGLLSDRRTLISEVLQKENYTTIAIHSNPYLSRFFQYDRGFEHFYQLKGEKKRSSALSNVRNRLFDVLRGENQYAKLLDPFFRKIYALVQTRLPLAYARASEMNEAAFSWFRNHDQEDPFFLWVHYMDPHTPYLPPPHAQKSFKESVSPSQMYELHYKLLRAKKDPRYRLTKREKKDLYVLYQAEVSYFDEKVGEFVHSLRENGLLEGTLLILTADHGEAFGEHGTYEHGGSLHDEVIHVPLFVRFPHGEAMTIDQPVSLLDLCPTICDFLDIERPASYQGRSFLPRIYGDTGTRGGIFCELSHQGGTMENHPSLRKIAYRTKHWKYIYTAKGQDELYNVDADPKEKRNIIGTNDPIRENLREKIQEHIELIENSKGTLKKRVKKRITKLKELS